MPQTARPFLLATATLCALSCSVAAADKVTFLTSWFAQAEHGGFYEAKGNGTYDRAGLDVTIKMGGPQVNGMQLLLAGEADAIMGYDIQVLKTLESGAPVVTVGASFQSDLQGMMTHDDVKSLADLKDKTILIATSGRTSWWPWMQATYKYSNDQTKAYTFNLQPFFADPNVVQQAYPSSEPYQAKEKGVPVKFFLFAKDGYPPYGSTIVTTQDFAAKHPDVLARFVKASMQGWKDYLADPSAGNALIKIDNPKMTDGQLAFGIEQLKLLDVVGGGDAKSAGIGIMTEARWKATYDYLVGAGLLSPKVDWHAAYTDRFVAPAKVLP